MNEAQLQQNLSALKRLALKIFKAATPVDTGYQKEHIFIRDVGRFCRDKTKQKLPTSHIYIYICF